MKHVTLSKLLALILALTLILGSCAALPGEAGGPDGGRDDVSNVPQTPGDGADDGTVPSPMPPEDADNGSWAPERGGYYYDVKNVVLYLEAYGELPENYITKNEARRLGWEGGSVEDYLEGAAIGGDRFGNYEELLPVSDGRTYTECDIDTHGYGSRGSRRLVFSSDGLYFYTADHYESFKKVTVTDDHDVVW